VAELVRTNDPALISVVEVSLQSTGVPYQVVDRNMAVLEGTIGVIQVRILVPDDYEELARGLLTEAELDHLLRP
jgi:Putative prokaryotic signal transducing protein